MKLTREFFQETINGFFRMSEAARNAGGIPLVAVVDGRQDVPEGWVLEPRTLYYLPPNVVLR